MPELDGLQATERILAAGGTARILIVTTLDLDEYVYTVGIEYAPDRPRPGGGQVAEAL